MPPPPTAFTLTVRVAPDDIDAQAHVNNVAYLRWVQDAAVAHWLALAPPAVKAAVTWVVRRHELDYRKPGFPGDTLTVRTWVGEPTAATWERFTEITRAADGDLLASARTVWVVRDAGTPRPRRIEAAVAKAFTAR